MDLLLYPESIYPKLVEEDASVTSVRRFSIPLGINVYSAFVERS
jgi:hypothetical protein